MLARDFKSTIPDDTARSHSESMRRIHHMFLTVNTTRHRTEIEKIDVEGRRGNIVALTTAAGRALDTDPESCSNGQWLPFGRDVRLRLSSVRIGAEWKVQQQHRLPGGVEIYNGKSTVLSTPPQ